MQQRVLCYSRVLLGLMLAAAVAVIFMTGCSGSAGAPQAASTGSAVNAGLAGLGSLPSPLDVNRDAATLEAGLDLKGSSFRQDLASINVAIDGDSAHYQKLGSVSSNPLYENACFAFYSFDLGSTGYLGVPLVFDLGGSIPTTFGDARVYAGFPDYDKNLWSWEELNRTSSFSWGESHPHTVGSGSQGKLTGWATIALVVFTDDGFDVSRVGLKAATGPAAGGTLAFSKGWDGTIKGRTEFDGSVHVVGDGLGRLHVSYYDSSNGQLFYMQLHNRIWTTMAADCDGDVGLSSDLALSPAGALYMPYYDADKQQGPIKWMAPESMDSLVWSPRSNFDTGDDGSGLPPDDVGRHPSIVWDSDGFAHIFYEDATTGRIKHAYMQPGLTTWTTEFVSPAGDDAHRPVGLSSSSGVYCAFVVNAHTSPFDCRVIIAIRGAAGWEEDTLASDVGNPLSAENNIGFCDGSVRPGTDEAVIAYSSLSGLKLVHRDLAARNTLLTEMVNPAEGSGAFVKLAMMGDGSVRLAQFNPKEYTIYFETGDIPTQEGFVSVPAVQFGGNPDEDCDDLDFWVNPVADANGLHDAALVTLESYSVPAVQSTKKEFKGHVTLLK